ncbi:MULTISPECIES: hypothetical protein [Leptolyngbya]|nr:hypothetical protein [Leptolyngbya sp. FACHB-1624]
MILTLAEAETCKVILTEASFLTRSQHVHRRLEKVDRDRRKQQCS